MPTIRAGSCADRSLIAEVAFPRRALETPPRVSGMSIHFGGGRLGRWLVVLCAAAVILASCVPYRRLDQPGVNKYEGVPRVLVGGDSITVSAQSHIKEELAEQTAWWTHVRAGNGWLMADFRAADDPVLNDLGFVPDAAIINIGTNDAEACDLSLVCGPEWVASELDDVWSAYDVAGVPCRIAVTIVYEPAGITSINDRIALLQSLGTISAVADWKAYSAAHPNWFLDQEGHLALPGREAYGEFLVDQLGAHCP